MKKTALLLLLMAATAFVSVAQDYPVIAREYCDCFKMLKDTMNSEYREILVRVSKQKDLQEAFSKELQALNTGKRTEFLMQLERIGTQMDSDESEAGRCGMVLDEKYEKHIDTPEKEKKFNARMIEELMKNKDCEFLAAIVSFALAFGEEE
jgi:hypothetical protein